MIKETIKFYDFNGEEHEKDFYFHLSKKEVIAILAELMPMFEKHLEEQHINVESMDEAEVDKRFEEYLISLVSKSSKAEQIDTFFKIIEKSYGRKSEDGFSFEKSSEETVKFMQSPACDELVVSFIRDSSLAADFVTGILPKNVEFSLKEAKKKDLKKAK